MTRPFKNLHKVRKRLASGERKFYYYAWRGGPALHSEFGTPEFAAEFAKAHNASGGVAADTFESAIVSYLSSPKFASLATRTREEYRRSIDEIRKKFGTAKIQFFNQIETRRVIYQWRDGFAATPRKADHLVAVLSAILTYLVDQARLERNVAVGIKKLHRSNRADVIWTDSEIEQICLHASKELAWTVRLAALTGMRTGDLIEVPWSAVEDSCIDWRTNKNKVDVLIPLTAELENLLGEIPKVATTIVTNTSGEPWTEDGLKTMWGRARKNTSLVGKRFHDLRGTAATKFCLAGLSDNEIASIIGWKPNRVSEIRARYVDRAVIVRGVIDRLEKNKDRTKTVNRTVNQRKEQGGNDA